MSKKVFYEMWRLTNVPSQAMTTVYLLKQMIRLWSASSSWNTFERFLLKTHWGPAHAAGSPPRCQHLGQSRLQSNAEAAGQESAALLSQRSAPHRWQKSRHSSLSLIPAAAAAAPVWQNRSLLTTAAQGLLAQQHLPAGGVAQAGAQTCKLLYF